MLLWRRWLDGKYGKARRKKDRVKICWRIIMYFDNVLRGIGQVIFADNPVSGVIVMVTMFIISPWVGYLSLLSVLSSTLMAELLDLDWEKYRTGIYGYNGYLVGAGLATFLEFNGWLQGFPAMGLNLVIGALSTVVLLAFSRVVTPCFTLPFATLNTCVFMGSALYTYFRTIALLYPSLPTEVESPFVISFGTLYYSVFQGISQIYFMADPIAGIMVFLATFIAFPPGALFCLAGSAFGTLGGYLLGVPNQEIRFGLWGYNPSLTCLALSVFLKHSVKSYFVIITGAALTVILYGGSRPIALVLGFPPSTFAFCFTSIIILGITNDVWGISAPPNGVTKCPSTKISKFIPCERRKTNEPGSSPLGNACPICSQTNITNLSAAHPSSLGIPKDHHDASLHDTTFEVLRPYSNLHILGSDSDDDAGDDDDVIQPSASKANKPTSMISRIMAFGKTTKYEVHDEPPTGEEPADPQNPTADISASSSSSATDASTPSPNASTPLGSTSSSTPSPLSAASPLNPSSTPQPSFQPAPPIEEDDEDDGGFDPETLAAATRTSTFSREQLDDDAGLLEVDEDGISRLPADTSSKTAKSKARRVAKQKKRKKASKKNKT